MKEKTVKISEVAHKLVSKHSDKTGTKIGRLVTEAVLESRSINPKPKKKP